MGEPERGNAVIEAPPPASLSWLRSLDVDELRQRYEQARPFPHIALDDLLPSRLLDEMVEEIQQLEVDPLRDFYATHEKRSISDFQRLPPTTARLIWDFNSAPFLEFLERMTGIDGLIPDPYLEGGGIHQIGSGGYLKVHTDFNFHRKLRLHRRLNLLLYLNRAWEPEWGGALELWDSGMRKAEATYLPLFNRLVVFSTTDESYHGHPDPLACPPDVTRNSIALYYYTSHPAKKGMHFQRSTMTNYQLRPSEKFASGRAHYLLNQLEIRVPGFRSMMTALRRLR